MRKCLNPHFLMSLRVECVWRPSHVMHAPVVDDFSDHQTFAPPCSPPQVDHDGMLLGPKPPLESLQIGQNQSGSGHYHAFPTTFENPLKLSQKSSKTSRNAPQDLYSKSPLSNLLKTHQSSSNGLLQNQPNPLPIYKRNSVISLPITDHCVAHTLPRTMVVVPWRDRPSYYWILAPMLGD